MKRITLVGGGLAGSLAAVYLAKRGYEVNIYERRPDMRNVEIPAGKSINLALSTRGLRALEKVGMADAILENAIPMNGRMMHSEAGELSYQPYGTDGQHINSVSRAHLNIQLLKLADEHENVHQHFNMKCSNVNLKSGTCWFTNEVTNERVEVKADYVLGGDGAFSAVRQRMMKTSMFNYSQDYTNAGYKELCIEPVNGEFAIDPNALHIWPRGDFMMIALPNPDKTFTCTLFMPPEGEVSFEKLVSDEDIVSFFEKYFADAIPLMPDYLSDFKNNPMGSLVTVRCFPWNKGKATLIGDACHAVVPFYGQGMNCAFEDCEVLDDCLEEFGDWDTAMKEYEIRRKPNADAIADLAIQNYKEMRDSVGNKDFLHYKKVEHDLCDLHPDIFQSQYEMVTFSNIAYSDAKTKGAENTKRVYDLIADGHEDKISDRDFVKEWFSL
ncbi:MAG: FAD-dependent oxidoreductase [Bacteroidia bacterium]